MKPIYMLFAYDQYYPVGGTNDFLDFFERMEDIATYIAKLSYRCDFYRVLDLETFDLYSVNNTEHDAADMKFVFLGRLR